MSPGRLNGTCHLNDDEWVEYRQRANDMEAIIKEIREQNSDLVEYCSHLKKLDSLERIENYLMSAATGRTQLDLGAARMVFKILGAVIITLLFALAYLITGQSLGWLSLPLSKAAAATSQDLSKHSGE